MKIELVVKALENYSEKENLITLAGPRGSQLRLYQAVNEPMPNLGDRFLLESAGEVVHAESSSTEGYV